MSDNNPCISCGACCAHFRASFYWSEAELSLGGTVPPELVDKLNERFVVMKGTNRSAPYCVALNGAIGEQVGCSIYPLRSSVCRDFPYSWQNGMHNPSCDQARAAWGLPPLSEPLSEPLMEPLTEPAPSPAIDPASLPLVAEADGLREMVVAPAVADVANDARPDELPPEDPHPDSPSPCPPKVA